MEWVVSSTLRPLYSREGPGTHCIGGWVGLRACLDRCGKSHPHRDSIPDRSESQYRLSSSGSPNDVDVIEAYMNYVPSCV
jgi:hypothetical protein